MSSGRNKLQRWRRRSWVRVGWRVAIAFLVGWLAVIVINLGLAAQRSTEAYFVLGGSIMREIYVAQLVQAHPDRAVLISQGSPPPCIRLIFEREQAPLDKVWLENCAKSTFENFYFSLPILREWGVRRISLITSQTHMPRALWMARLILGTHGIWVDIDLAPEQGIPGNSESWPKTFLDLGRSGLWAIASQVYTPRCGERLHLSEIDLADWRERGFKCEHQGNIS